MFTMRTNSSGTGCLGSLAVSILAAFPHLSGKSPDQPGLNSALMAGGCELDSLST